MTDHLPTPHPNHRRHIALAAVAVGAALMLAFHHFLALWPYGISLLIFTAVFVAGALIMSSLTGECGNKWAFLFLIPVVAGNAASLLYASDVPRTLGFAFAFFGLLFFSYWLTAPAQSLAETTSLWPRTILADGFESFQAGASALKELRFGPRRDYSKILLGLIIAIPFLCVFLMLFMSADPIFRKAIGDLFGFELDGQFWLFKLPRDLIVGYVMTGFAWVMVVRAFEKRRALVGEHLKAVDATVASTFLGFLNLLFIAFLVFQVRYFFGGAAFLQEHGLTFADYARHGFFELLAAAGLVFAIIWFLYVKTNFAASRVALFAGALILETALLIVSALRRVFLYMNEFGYSVSRVWAIIVILIIAAVLAVMLIGLIRKLAYRPLAKTIFLGLIFSYSALLLVNVEGMVAWENVNRYLAGETKLMDVNYLTTLSSDAVPALVELTRRGHGNLETTPIFLQDALNDRTNIPSYVKYEPQTLKAFLFLKSSNIAECAKDIRCPVLSDYRAQSLILGL